MFSYDANLYSTASEEEIPLNCTVDKTNFLKQLVDQAIMSILESFKLTCDVASVFALLFTPSSFVHEQPLSAI